MYCKDLFTLYLTSKVYYLHYATAVFVSDSLKRRRYIVFLTLNKKKKQPDATEFFLESIGLMFEIYII